MEKNWEEATRYLHKSLELNQNTPYTHSQLGIVLESQNKMPEALKAYRTALRIDPNFIPANYNLAVALFKLGRRDEARDYFEKVVKDMPESEMAETAREFLTKINPE
jgi:superkiller protein 3